MILLDYKDRRPIYEQIVEKFKHLILSGVLNEGDNMPSVRSLAVSLSINPGTIQRAYAKLEQEGFIYTVSGKGSFVTGTDSILKEQQNEWFEKFKELLAEGFLLEIEPEQMCAYIKKEANQ
ncbi:MAG: GntR family transcriptional regulator [Lachnospiraceae bacterium]|nr:GntR family transcriptional regulator [Lachnospiraceae bacterium]